MTMTRYLWILAALMLCACGVAQGHEDNCGIVVEQDDTGSGWADLRRLIAGLESMPCEDDVPVTEGEIVVTHDEVVAFMAAHPELATIDLGYLQWLEDTYGPAMALEWLNDQLRIPHGPRPQVPPPMPTQEVDG